jgi:hypothetical protein
MNDDDDDDVHDKTQSKSKSKSSKGHECDISCPTPRHIRILKVERFETLVSSKTNNEVIHKVIVFDIHRVNKCQRVRETLKNLNQHRL